MFVGRNEELARLTGLWEKSIPSLVTIRGRRRIGKSTLVMEFARRSKARFIKMEGVQPAEGVDNDMQLAAFCRQLGRQTGVDKAKADNWFDAFARLDDALRGRGWTVVLLDEISWMGKYDPCFAGELKQAWDNWFSKHPQTIMFLCGSVSAWIDKKIVRSKAFVGRPSMNLTLRELPMEVCTAFWGRNANRVAAREILDVLSVTGGVPEYLENINPSLSADENIRNLCYRPGALLVNEFEDIFNDTLDANLAMKRRMLHAIAEAPHDGHEIASALGIEYNGHVSANLMELETAGFISRDVGENPLSRKRTKSFRYRISDNYTRFYLKYIEPNLDAIAKDAYKFVSLEQLPGWDSILGLQFENLIINNLGSLLQKIGLGQTLVTSASQYRQNATKRMKGCQIDLLLQTRKCAYAIEMKRRHFIGEEVVHEVERKLSALKVARSVSVRPVLVYDGELSSRIPADGYFSFIVSADSLLGR